MVAATRRSIVVTVPMFVAHGRAVLEGILEFGRQHPRWWVTVLRDDTTASEIQRSHPDGIIGFILREEIKALSQSIPLVSVANNGFGIGLPAVYFDDSAAGRFAAEHLLGCGFRHFAFLGNPEEPDGEGRLEGYRTRLGAAGHSVNLVPIGSEFGGWAAFDPEPLAECFRALPKPVGLFAAWDLIAYHASRICEYAKIRVPEDIAILGVDNDPVICNASRPALTSVRVPSFEIGFRAAELLERMLDGEAAPSQPLVLQPLEPIVRMSTEIIAVQDPMVATALQYMRTHAHKCIGVVQMWDALGFNRKQMEVRFRKTLGRSPGQELTRVRLDRLKQLLLDTSYNSEELARACGFATASYMISVFHKHQGITPAGYRESARRVSGNR